VIAGHGGDNDLGLYTSRSHRRSRGRLRLVLRLATGLVAVLAIFALVAMSVLCGALDMARVASI
jgi:hypothetical protein